MLIAPGTVPYGEWHSSVSRPSLYIVMPLPVDLRTTGGVGKVELFMVTGPGLEDSGVSLAGMGGVQVPHGPGVCADGCGPCRSVGADWGRPSGNGCERDLVICREAQGRGS